MSNEALFIGIPVGILGFLFLIWKKLKDDYTSPQIFTFAFIVSAFLLAGIILGSFITNLNNLSTAIFNDSGLWFWVGFVALAIGFVVGYKTQKGGKDFKPRQYELLEGVCTGFIFFLIPIFFVSGVVNENIKILTFAIFLGFLLYLYFMLNKNYKKFTLYKSGKLGFASLTILGIFFFVRTIVAIIDPSMLSFIGKLDAVVSVLVSFIFFISLYRLSQKV